LRDGARHPLEHLSRCLDQAAFAVAQEIARLQ
jgi:hypothetical protein